MSETFILVFNFLFHLQHLVLLMTNITSCFDIVLGNEKITNRLQIFIENVIPILTGHIRNEFKKTILTNVCKSGH